MKKKIYAVLMAVCLVLGILPVQAFAETEKAEVKVTVTGKAVVGEKLKADLSELENASEAVIQWQKKGSGEKDLSSFQCSENVYRAGNEAVGTLRLLRRHFIFFRCGRKKAFFLFL